MMEIRNTEVELQRFRMRAVVMGCVVFLAFCLLVWRLLVLQVERHENLPSGPRAIARRWLSVPNRGQILDRNGVVLATNYSAYTLEITRSKGRGSGRDHRRAVQSPEITPRDRRRIQAAHG